MCGMVPSQCCGSEIIKQVGAYLFVFILCTRYATISFKFEERPGSVIPNYRSDRIRIHNTDGSEEQQIHLNILIN